MRPLLLVAALFLGNDVLLNVQDDGKLQDPVVVKITQGDTLTVRLPVQQGTGYNWEFEPTGSLRFIEPGQDNLQGGTPGATETVDHSFVALKPGKSKLVFKYRRVFEKDQPSKKTKTIEVEIRKPKP